MEGRITDNANIAPKRVMTPRLSRAKSLHDLRLLSRSRRNFCHTSPDRQGQQVGDKKDQKPDDEFGRERDGAFRNAPKSFPAGTCLDIHLLTLQLFARRDDRDQPLEKSKVRARPVELAMFLLATRHSRLGPTHDPGATDWERTTPRD